MDVKLNGTIYFKHVYATNMEDWGVLAFPRSQDATNAGRRYHHGDPVLLAIPFEPEEVAGAVPAEVCGRVFAICTLAVIQGAATREIANPELVRQYPNVVERWDTALPILKLWRLTNPRPYREFGQELSETVQKQRGQLIQLVEPDPAAEVRQWLRSVPCDEAKLTHSSRVKALLARFNEAP